MDSAQRERLAARGLVVRDDAGQDAVRISLEYLPAVDGPSRAHRGEALRSTFERVAATPKAAGLKLDPESLSINGQLIEGVVPLDRYEAVARDLRDDDMRVQLVQSFRAT